MDKTAEKITETFMKYGLTISVTDVVKTIENSKAFLKENPTQKEFIAEVCERFCFGKRKFILTDYEAFYIETKLGAEWKELPQWFAKNMVFEYISWKRGFHTNGRNKVFSDHWMKVVPKGRFEYFENQLQDGEREKYLLEKMFQPESSDLLYKRKKMIEKAYVRMDKALENNDGLHELTQKVQGLLMKEYQDSYSKKYTTQL